MASSGGLGRGGRGALLLKVKTKSFFFHVSCKPKLHNKTVLYTSTETGLLTFMTSLTFRFLRGLAGEFSEGWVFILFLKKTAEVLYIHCSCLVNTFERLFPTMPCTKSTTG